MPHIVATRLCACVLSRSKCSFPFKVHGTRELPVGVDQSPLDQRKKQHRRSTCTVLTRDSQIAFRFQLLISDESLHARVLLFLAPFDIYCFDCAMGVQGLWSLLEPVGRRIQIEALSNKVVAVGRCPVVCNIRVKPHYVYICTNNRATDGAVWCGLGTTKL